MPRSSRNQIVGKEGNAYKIKVTSPPVDGKANQALVSLLAKRLGIPKRNIEIIAGETSRTKRIRLYGISLEDVVRVMEGSYT